MNEWLQWWMAFSREQWFLAWLLAVSVHAGLLVACGCVVERRLRGQSAAARHVLWMAVLVGLLLMVPARQLVPRVSIGVLEPRSPDDSVVNRLTPPDQSASGAWGSTRDAAGDPTSPTPPATNVGMDAEVGSPAATSRKPRASVPEVSIASPAGERFATPMRVANLLGLGIYLAGVLVQLMRAAIGWRSLRQHARWGQSLPASAARVLRECAGSVGLNDLPDCRMTSRVEVPLMYGWWKPQVLVPATFGRWSPTQQRDSLLHELAHIVRRDGAVNLMAWIVASLYWFHPAVHGACARLRRAREDATDDLVLRSGAESSHYASTLLEVTSGLRRFRASPGVAMASTLPIESRLRRILDHTVRRDAPSWRMRVVVGASFIALGSIGFQFAKVFADPPRKPPPLQVAATGGATFFKALTSLGLAEVPQAERQWNVSGTVRDEQGAPVADAVVVLREESSWRVSASPAMRSLPAGDPWIIDDVFARTRSKADGTYEFVDVRVPPIAERYRRLWTWDVVAAVESGAIGWAHLSVDQAELTEGRVRNLDLQLQPVSEISGRLLSADGSPLSGVSVRLSTLDQLQAAREMIRPQDPMRLDLNASSMQPLTVTDAEGRFQFPAVPRQRAASLVVEDPEHHFPPVRIAPAAAESPPPSPDAKEWVTSPADIRALPTIRLGGILTSATGQPLQGFQVRLGSTTRFVETDSSGHFELITTQDRLRQVARQVDGKQTVTLEAEQGTAGATPVGPFIPVRTSFSIEEVLGETPLKLVAHEGALLRGKVVSAENQAAVSNAPIAWNRQSDSTDTWQMVRTHDDGTFQVIAPKAKVRIGVVSPLAGFEPPTADSLFAQQAPRSAMHETVDLSDGESKTLAPFRVTPLKSVRVRVVGIDQKPIDGARVSANFQPKGNDSDDASSRRQLLGEQDLAVASIRTDSDGAGTLQLTSDEWELATVRASATIDGVTWFGQSFLSEGASQVQVHLKPPWEILGRVTVNGRPAPGVEVQVHTRLSSTDNSMLVSRSRAGATALTDDKGQYTFTVPAGGSYSVMVVRSPIDGKRVGRGYFPRLVQGNEFRAPDIDFLRPGDEVSTGSLRGVVRNVHGEPIEGAQVAVYQYFGSDPRRVVSPDTRRQVDTDREGRFTLNDLRKGRVRLHVYPPRRADGGRAMGSAVFAEVDGEDIEAILDHRIGAELPRLGVERVVDAQSVPKSDR